VRPSVASPRYSGVAGLPFVSVLRIATSASAEWRRTCLRRRVAATQLPQARCLTRELSWRVRARRTGAPRCTAPRLADVDAEDEVRVRPRSHARPRQLIATPFSAQDGSTPFHLAAAAGHLESVRLLLEKSDVDAEDSNGNTPAWVAFAAGQGDLARFLLEEGGADLDAACEDGKTYLHQAAQRKSADDVAWLLAHKASVKAKDRFSDSPLHAAAAAGAWRIGRVLIDSGADVNARGKARRNSLLTHLRVSEDLFPRTECVHAVACRSAQSRKCR